MTFGYAQPFSFKLGEKPSLQVSQVRHGVTEIALSDGKVVRATLRVKGMAPNPQKSGTFDISYDVVTEIVNPPASTVLAVHETLQ